MNTYSKDKKWERDNSQCQNLLNILNSNQNKQNQTNSQEYSNMISDGLSEYISEFYVRNKDNEGKFNKIINSSKKKDDK